MILHCNDEQLIIPYTYCAALGFYHMHQVFNRDEYISIQWENIKPGNEIQFRKYTNPNLTETFGTFSSASYDYSSIMHYGAYYFSANGKPTIVPKVSTEFLIA